MSDVVVTVMIDGKQAFVAGAAGALDACDHAVRSLTLARDHFASLAAPKAQAQMVKAQTDLAAAGAAAKPQDTSL